MAGIEPHARIRPLATRDLEEIVRYLDSQSTTAGDRFLEEFHRASKLLAEMPGLGPLRGTEGRLKGLRSWPLKKFGSYLLFYIPVDVGIEVVRIMHGSRDLDHELNK
jgi:toxin ParE1/3/4